MNFNLLQYYFGEALKKLLDYKIVKEEVTIVKKKTTTYRIEEKELPKK